MDFLYYTSLLIFGLIIGSFLNALVWRMYRGRSIWGYSECPSCRHRLKTADLIPVVSFILLKRHCRYCSRPISWQYPLVEIASALVFFLIGRIFFPAEAALGESWIFQLILLCAVSAVLVGIFVFDWKYYLIPDGLVVTGAALALIYRGFFMRGAFYDGVLGMLALGGFFGCLYLLSRGRWIGLGDAKLGIFLGLLLGLKLSLVMLMLAYIGGALVGAVLLLLKKKTLKGILPFGTFLTLATLISLLWGDRILNWYLRVVINL